MFQLAKQTTLGKVMLKRVKARSKSAISVLMIDALSCASLSRATVTNSCTRERKRRDSETRRKSGVESGRDEQVTKPRATDEAEREGEEAACKGGR